LLEARFTVRTRVTVRRFVALFVARLRVVARRFVVRFAAFFEAAAFFERFLEEDRLPDAMGFLLFSDFQSGLM